MKLTSTLPQLLALILPLAVLCACGQTPKVQDDAAPLAAEVSTLPTGTKAEPDVLPDMLLATANTAHKEVEETFITAATPNNVIDSPALWQAPDGSTWLYATAKDSDQILMFDGETGAEKGAFGSSGDGLNQFKRPNGIYVIDNLLLVVERDNHRVQVISLPAMQSIGFFGEDRLKQPYGIWARRFQDGIEVIVSDGYMSADNADVVPTNLELGERFRRFKVKAGVDSLTVEARGAFGAVDDAGAIRIAESIAGDVAQKRLLLAEEDQASGTRIKVYDINGQYTGQDVGAGVFKAQAEGISLYECADGSGYWIAADQFKDRTLFHVFDRKTLALKGSFAGNTTANTDGIWLHQAATSAFPNGALYAVHDDQAVAAFDWRGIAEAIGVRASCTP